MKKTIILLSPLWVPFVVLAAIRVLWFMAGADWTQPGLAAATAFSIGLVVLIIVMASEA